MSGVFALTTLCTTFPVMNFRAWIAALIAPDTLRAASEKIGLSHSTVTRQLSRDTLTPVTVIALCRAYGKSPVDGLVETGYLRREETGDVGVDFALDRASNRELLDAVLRRSDPEAVHLFGRDAGVINPADSAAGEADDGTVLPWTPRSGGIAADGSPDEDAENEGRGGTGSDSLP